MHNLKIDRTKLKELKLALPHGSIVRIARDLNITRHAVDMVFNGTFESEDVINAAVNIIEEKKQQIKQVEDRIDQVIKG